jgi:hypothetical protein
MDNKTIATDNVRLMLNQQLRMARAAAKVYDDPIAREEARLIAKLLKSIK